MSGADPFKWDLYICQVSEFNPDGFLLCQADDWGEEGGDPIEVLPSGGTRFRPRSADATTGAGCPMLVAWDGGKRIAIPLLDTMAAQKLPMASDADPEQFGATEGSFIAFGDTGEATLPMLSIDGATGFIQLKRDNGTEVSVDRGQVTLYTTDDQTETGRPVFFTVRDDGFAWESPYARGKLDATGWHVSEHGGARIDIGSLSMPAPLSALSTYAIVQAAMVALRGASVQLGPDTGIMDNVALATPITLFMTALTTFCTGLSTAIATAVGGAGPGGPAAASTFTAAAAGLLATLSSAAASLTTTMPSKSTMSS